MNDLQRNTSFHLFPFRLRHSGLSIPSYTFFFHSSRLSRKIGGICWNQRFLREILINFRILLCSYFRLLSYLFQEFQFPSQVLDWLTTFSCSRTVKPFQLVLFLSAVSGLRLLSGFPFFLKTKTEEKQSKRVENFKINLQNPF